MYARGTCTRQCTHQDFVETLDALKGKNRDPAMIYEPIMLYFVIVLYTVEAIMTFKFLWGDPSASPPPISCMKPSLHSTVVLSDDHH